MALGKLFRSTAFKLSLVYSLIVAIGAALVLMAVGWNVEKLLNEQIAETVETEITGLSEVYARGRIVRLVEVIERRSREPGSSLYLVTDHAGRALAGNIAILPEGVLDRPGLVQTRYERAGEDEASHFALARIFVLPGGFRLLVGRDLAERETLRRILARAFITSLVALTAIGTLGGLFVARRVLRRVNAMNESAATIMGGDLSQRLPMAGTGDELDRLAQNLNAMLVRIDELLRGLREVSDNIAHDLRTPLTRLRNGAERALRDTGSAADHRAALERVIAESDGLIRIFNALLMIARAEAGSGREGMADFDVAEAVRDVGELYEPSAEEAGVELVVDVQPELFLHGSRELLGQAIANLIDNGLKYGNMTSAAPAAKPKLLLSARRGEGTIEIAVADRGPGILETDRNRVLQRFVRLEGSRTQAGSGLGLSLVNAIAHLHKGTLRLEDSKPGLQAVLVLPTNAVRL